MAAKNVKMGKVKQVLRLHQTGMSNRKIGEALGLYKGTVNNYVNAASSDPLGIDALLEMDDEVLERRLCCGNPAYTDKRFEELSSRMDYIAKELNRKHVTRLLLWEEYCREVSDPYGYTQFCYHIDQHIKASKPSMVLSEERVGGKELYIDFAGDKMSYVNPVTGEIIKCEIFVATLPASDRGFAMAVPSQKTEDFIYALECCLRDIGGAPQILVTDNLKAAVTKADRYEPKINTVMNDFANHYGCVHIPTRSAKPKDKALVENHVHLVYMRVFAPLRDRMFFSIEELNVAIAEQMHKHNQKRMQQYDCTREERFLAIDKPNLKALPIEPFEIKTHAQFLVTENSYIYLGREKHYYSVPYKYIGKKVDVVLTRSLVRVYYGGEKIAEHQHEYGSRRYIEDEKHLPSYFKDYQKLSPEKYIERAERVSGTLAKVFTRMFSCDQLPPERLYKGCDGLLHLQKTTDPDIFEMACESALEYGQCRYKFIKNTILNGCSWITEDSSDLPELPNHANIRGKEYYQQDLFNGK